MDEGNEQERPLTPKQERFCEEYAIDLNGTQAAIRANYSEKTAAEQASRLLTNVKVQQRVAELKLAQSKRTEITADYVLNTIRDTIDRCRQAEPVMEWDAFAKEMAPTGEWEFAHQGVLKGCELLGKHLKLFTEKMEHSGPNGKPIEYRDLSALTDEELDAKYQAALAKAKEAKP